MINIFITLIVIVIWPIFYFLMRNNIKPKKNIILSVTIPQSAHHESETQAICHSFKNWLNITMLPLLLFIIPSFFMQSFGAALTWCMTWLLFVVFAPAVVFAKHRGKLMALKHDKNWHSKAEGQVKDSGEMHLDEDDYWLWGLLYNNPNDSHFLVKSRVGMNMSLNLAKPAGKALMVFAVLCILAMPFIGLWIWAEELTPSKLVLSATTLTARHTRDRYLIQLDAIESLELLETLPPAFRIAGTGLDNLYKGNFRVEGYGISRLCIQPKDPPFLVIKSGNHTFIMNDADSKVTREIYANLKAK